ncbi:polymorphic toxin type 23 domain-containing protein [Sphingobacterium sp. UBA1498]|uniref:polymorphic toxin type 23 domain-containing protein n=1 Tax=Sphingobacterium sp. UBA1498 TaxID=1947481 RepID=UPI0025D327F0|nr:polymorphic toxin type 23 domain-containing protein [Sphingobacterium sp. UBA1498]
MQIKRSFTKSSKGWGFGANQSVTFHAGEFSLSAGYGIINYSGHAGSGKGGWNSDGKKYLAMIVSDLVSNYGRTAGKVYIHRKQGYWVSVVVILH